MYAVLCVGDFLTVSSGMSLRYVAVESRPAEEYLIRPCHVCFGKRAGVALCLCDDGFQLEPGPG